MRLDFTNKIYVHELYAQSQTQEHRRLQAGMWNAQTGEFDILAQGLRPQLVHRIEEVALGILLSSKYASYRFDNRLYVLREGNKVRNPFTQIPMQGEGYEYRGLGTTVREEFEKRGLHISLDTEPILTLS